MRTSLFKIDEDANYSNFRDDFSDSESEFESLRMKKSTNKRSGNLKFEFKDRPPTLTEYVNVVKSWFILAAKRCGSLDTTEIDL